MPSRKTTDGEFRDVAHPITADARETISEIVLKAYGDMAPAAYNRSARAGVSI